MVNIVDTHALIWFLERSPRLGDQARQVLRDSAQLLVIPSIVLAEVNYLSTRGRVLVSLDDVIAFIEGDRRCVIWPLDIEVVRAMPAGLDIHDSIICGTALLYRNTLGEDVSIITRDEAIRTWGVIDVVW